MKALTRYEQSKVIAGLMYAMGQVPMFETRDGIVFIFRSRTIDFSRRA